MAKKEYAKFFYKCPYCKKGFSTVQPDGLENCMVSCRHCGNFLKKYSFFKKESASRIEIYKYS